MVVVSGKELWNIIDENISYSIGNRKWVRFYKDPWCLKMPLKENFHALYEVSRTKGKLVTQVSNWVASVLNLDLDYSGRLIAGEIVQVVLFSDILSNIVLKMGGFWGDKNKHYSVKSVYVILEEKQRCTSVPGLVNIPSQRIWRTYLVLPRVVFFYGHLWEAESPPLKILSITYS